jgi:hypothetical protein
VHPAGVPQDARFPLFRWPPPEERAGYEDLARGGRAGELFDRWAPRCTDTTTWALPEGAVDVRA